MTTSLAKLLSGRWGHGFCDHFHVYFHMGSAPQEKNHNVCMENRKWARAKAVLNVSDQWKMVARPAKTEVPHSMLSCSLITPVRENSGRHRNCLRAHLSRIPSQAESEEEWQEWGAVVKVMFVAVGWWVLMAILCWYVIC